MKKNYEEPSWMKGEKESTEKEAKKGKTVKNPAAAKSTVKPPEPPKEKELNYLRTKLKPSVEARFRYVVSLEQGKATLEGKKKPTIGDVFDRMVAHYEKKLNL